jgi:hypothetical protein
MTGGWSGCWKTWSICRSDASRHAYPHELSAGSHGFAFESLSGSIALVRLQDARQVELGDFESKATVVQESLF